MALELEFAVFHCAFFLARWSPPYLLAVILPLPWPRGPSSQPSLILVFMGSLWGWLWWGAGIAQVLVTRPGCLPPPPLDRSFREATTPQWCYFPSASFHRYGGTPWSHTGSLAWSLPDVGYFYSPFYQKEQEWPLSSSCSQPQSSVPQLIHPDSQICVLGFFSFSET